MFIILFASGSKDSYYLNKLFEPVLFFAAGIPLEVLLFLGIYYP